jgi:hypothetical protein
MVVAVIGLLRTNCVIVKLQGGLGNQMFQYATARSLSKDGPVYFDLSFFSKNHFSTENFTARDYKLNLFKKLKGKEFNQKLIRAITTKNKKYLFVKRLLPDHFKNITYLNDENISSYQPKYVSIYLDGYFQDPTHFESIRGILLSEFKFPEIPLNLNYLADKISRCQNAISIHVRRGDYLKPAINDVHGVLSSNYYKNATDYMSAEVANPTYFIFSDDAEWCNVNLPFIHNEKYIVGQKYNDWVDMHLMSLCKHHIIANSSFSWWGAWLNQNPDKIVLAPESWHADKEVNERFRHIIPGNWMRL